jgi:hypothetical protein
MFTQVGIPLLAAMFLEVNALIIAAMLATFLIHEETALWDVSYATTARTVTPIDQHVHSFLEMIPLMAIVCVVSIHWSQFLALFGASELEAGAAAECLHRHRLVDHFAVRVPTLCRGVAGRFACECRSACSARGPYRETRTDNVALTSSTVKNSFDRVYANVSIRNTGFENKARRVHSFRNKARLSRSNNHK